MAIIKCKMCGGDLNIAENNSVAVCEYCGTQQTVPSADNEKKLTQFGRANRLRMACEFDKAAGVYESIVADFPEEAEAYWGLVLCKYGIEYVDDPATGKKIPTCHRSSFDSVMDDSNLDQALENADVTAQKVYREEAKQFERIRKGILEVSSSEKPYDIFICYKETDEKGDRTLDSVMAQDLYAALTDKGYRVFFSRITLQGKLGEAYEPYIFAALNSAKVMLAMGTCYEYYNAVWVKNEWSRYLKICEADKSKHLIPCYKDLDPEDMPREFKHLQGADLGKMGAVQDILFNMEKYIPLKKETLKETVVVQQSAETTKVQAMLERAFLFLEDGDWNAANEYCEKALDIDPKCAEGYLGKLMVDLRVKKQEELANCAKPFDQNSNYIKAVRFADDKLRDMLTGTIESINIRNKNACFEDIYARAKSVMDSANTEERFKKAAEQFESISDYKDAVTLASACREKAEEIEKDAILAAAEKKMTVKIVASYEEAISLLETIPGWKDADDKAVNCRKTLEDLKKEMEIIRKKMEEDAKKTRKVIMIVAPIVCVIIAVVFVFVRVIIPGNKYNDAVALMERGQYEQAIAAFEALDGYKDSGNLIFEAKYREAILLLERGEGIEAYEAFLNLDGYKDSAEKIKAIYEQEFKSVDVGNYIFFGAYEQNNDTNDGREAIEWLVLETNGSRALVISKYALDCKRYNENNTDITWETCSLRKWLNEDFLDFAFSDSEKAMIPTVTVSADRNPEYGTFVGNATEDQVFLLSITEANKYFGSDSARQCKPTDYTVANGAGDNSSSDNSYWWLRTLGKNRVCAAYVFSGGGISEIGSGIMNHTFVVRPAMWIDLNA